MPKYKISITPLTGPSGVNINDSGAKQLLVLPIIVLNDDIVPAGAGSFILALELYRRTATESVLVPPIATFTVSFPASPVGGVLFDHPGTKGVDDGIAFDMTYIPLFDPKVPENFKIVVRADTNAVAVDFVRTNNGVASQVIGVVPPVSFAASATPQVIAGPALDWRRP